MDLFFEEGSPWCKNSLSLADVVPLLQDFLMPPTLALGAGEPFAQTWPAGGPWQVAEKALGDVMNALLGWERLNYGWSRK